MKCRKEECEVLLAKHGQEMQTFMGVVADKKRQFLILKDKLLEKDGIFI